MDKWRKEGWENPYPDNGRTIPENIPWKVFHDCFEAGADKMLKAVREDFKLEIGIREDGTLYCDLKASWVYEKND